MSVKNEILLRLGVFVGATAFVLLVNALAAATPTCTGGF